MSATTAHVRSADDLDPGLAPPMPSRRMTIWEFAGFVRAFHLAGERIARSDGPLVQLQLGPRSQVPPIVNVATPAGAHDVLGSGAVVMDKTGPIHTENRDLIGPNVFNMTTDAWKPRRRVLQPLFTRKHVDGYGALMAEAADDVAETWRARSTIDADHEMRRLTLRVIGRCLFGTLLDEQAEAMEPHVQRTLRHNTTRSIVPPQLHGLLGVQRRRAMASRDALRAVVEGAMDAVEAGRVDGGAHAELITLMQQAADPETGQGLSREDVRDELMVFLLAGHDTTATALAAAMWLLGRHPSEQERAADEVAALGDRPVEAADVPSLPYVTQVLKEAMRLYPPAAGIARVALADAVVDGRRVPEGASVFVQIYAMHRDPALWDDPLRFDPDRFGPGRVDEIDRWQYLPFGAGPRSCIGDHFAMLEATLGLATILRRCRLTSIEDDFPTQAPFTMTAKGSIPVRVTPR